MRAATLWISRQLQAELNQRRFKARRDQRVGQRPRLRRQALGRAFQQRGHQLTRFRLEPMLRRRVGQTQQEQFGTDIGVIILPIGQLLRFQPRQNPP